MDSTQGTLAQVLAGWGSTTERRHGRCLPSRIAPLLLASCLVLPSARADGWHGGGDGGLHGGGGFGGAPGGYRNGYRGAGDSGDDDGGDRRGNHGYGGREAAGTFDHGYVDRRGPFAGDGDGDGGYRPAYAYGRPYGYGRPYAYGRLDVGGPLDRYRYGPGPGPGYGRPYGYGWPHAYGRPYSWNSGWNRGWSRAWYPGWQNGGFWGYRPWRTGWYNWGPNSWSWWGPSAVGWGVMGLATGAVITGLVNGAIANQSTVIVVPDSTIRLDFASVLPAGQGVVSFRYIVGTSGPVYQGQGDCRQGLFNAQPPRSLAEAQLLHTTCQVAYGNGNVVAGGGGNGIVTVIRGGAPIAPGSGNGSP